MCEEQHPLCTPERIEFESKGCGIGDIVCESQKAFRTAMYDLGDQIVAGTKQALASVGTTWLNVPGIDVLHKSSSPGQTAKPLDVGVHAGEGITGSSITLVMGWVKWIALGICVLSLILAGARMAWHARSGDSQQHMDRIGAVLLATILISGGVGLVTGVLQPGDSMGTAAVAFIQNSTWWYTVAFGIIGVIAGGVKMAWEQRADAGKDLLRSLLTLLTVSGVGLSMISYLQFAGDEYAKWIIGKSLDCQPATGQCFADKLILLMFAPGVGTLGLIMVIIFAIIALLVSMIQIVLLIIRNGLLVILAGVLPLSAAATNTTSGKQMFNKVIGWIIGFLLYKPTAATIYAASFKLSQGQSGDVILSTLTGITLMVLSLIALPAMMALIVPAVGNVTGGGGGAAAGVAAAALPTGAVMLSKGGGGTGKGPSGAATAAGGGKSPSGSSNSSSLAPPNTANRRPGGGPSGASGGGSSGGGGAGSSSGASGGSSSPSGAGSAGGHGGASSAASGGSGASGSGPSGAGSSAGGQGSSAAAAMMAAQVGIQAAQAGADEATGAGGEPDGSQ